MKKYIITFLILLSFKFAFSQANDSLKIKNDSIAATQNKPAKVKKDNRPMKERIAFGLGTSFWITPSQTYVEITPVLAYRFPKTLITGIGYRYIYRHDRVWGRDLNAWGPNVFARVNLLPKIYLWTQYEILQNEHLTQIAGNEVTKSTQTTDSWFAGLGFMKTIGKYGRGGISFQILYNFLYDRDDNLYYSPVTYQVGYFF
jgi:hypothetical protein